MSEEPTDTEILDWLSRSSGTSPGAAPQPSADGLKVQMGKDIREAAIKAMEAEAQ